MKVTQIVRCTTSSKVQIPEFQKESFVVCQAMFQIHTTKLVCVHRLCEHPQDGNDSGKLCWAFMQLELLWWPEELAKLPEVSHFKMRRSVNSRNASFYIWLVLEHTYSKWVNHRVFSWTEREKEKFAEAFISFEFLLCFTSTMKHNSSFVFTMNFRHG